MKFKLMNLLWAIPIVLLPILIFLMIDSGNAGSILKGYNSLRPDKSNGISRQLVFLSNYSIASGDLHLAEMVGVSEETMQQLMEDPLAAAGYTDDTTGGSATQALAASNLLTYDELMNDATQRGVNAYYSSCAGNTEINGRSYFYEKQGPDKMMVKPLDPSSSNSPPTTIDSDGCFLYACTAMASAMTGKAITIENVLTAFGVGYTYQDGQFVNTGTGLMNHSPKSGSQPQLKENLAAVGITVTTSQGSTDFNAIKEDMLANDNVMYILYYNHGYTSSGRENNHWQSIVGVHDGKLIVTGNCWGQNVTEISSWNDLYNYNFIKYTYKVVY